MRGDFSAWNKDRSRNFRGTLHQQGRVLVDRDWNAQTEIMGEWQETAARDVFGAGVAAVSADAAGSFKVTAADKSSGTEVEVSINKGRVWADGLLVELAKDSKLTATYLGPPIQAAPLKGDMPAADSRDAVVLEAWLTELSAFQVPDLLLEKALGGVDTTERVQTAFRLRLYRMADGDTCNSIIPKLRDDFDTKGKLTVELNPTTTIDGDCPVVEGGGFTGFEHRLYRIEIADVDAGAHPGAHFKWSQMNGGLVGRGDYDLASKTLDIKGNRNAILLSGTTSFYMEVLEFDNDLNCWQVMCGATAGLSNGKLDLNAADVFKGTLPTASKSVFFRLWNGIEKIADYVPAKKLLSDKQGILLHFEAEAAGKYTPSDFWTFEARAGNIGNDRVLIGNPSKVIAGDPVASSGFPSQGIFYHRVPLAKVHWTSNTPPVDEMEDCRRPFQPLTRLKTCCTYRVGDGIHSHGDFKKIQDAIDALPNKGGEICILPGLYEENVVLQSPHNRDIILKGCGRRTVIKAIKDDPAIHVKYGQGIAIESLAVEAHEDGIGILLHGEELTAAGNENDKYLKNIVLAQLLISAAKNHAIKGYTAQSLTLSDSLVYIEEGEWVRTRKPAVYLEGDDMLIERNEIRVLPHRAESEDEWFITNDPDLFKPALKAAGGLQIGGGSERVRILNNLIINGRGNGITLGRIDLMKDGKEVPGRDPFEPKDQQEDLCAPDDGHIDDGKENEDGFVAIAGPPLYDILIKSNRIFNMGRNGIGVAAFLSMGEAMDLSDIKGLEKVAVKGVIMVSKLVISENRIERCVNISPQEIPSKMSYLMGYGGIALSVVEDLVVRDNVILDNCTSCLYPVCGIFVLAVIGLDISRNEISERLKQDYGEVTPETVKSGPRGGIWVFIAMGQMDIFSGLRYDKRVNLGILGEVSGSRATKIHENVVSVPLGRSLTMTILGDASILGNRFTSNGIVPVDILGLFMSIFVNKNLNMSGVLQLLSLVASNVLIFDLGSFVIYMEYKRLEAKGSIHEFKGIDAKEKINLKIGNNLSNVYAGLAVSSRIINMFTSAGMIHFSDNQCKLNAHSRRIGIAYSSIFIAGLADSGFHDNQSSCNIPRSLLVTNASLFGGTQRATGNWFKETYMNVGFSAMTCGILNATTDNESVHCLFIWGMQMLKRHNLVLSGLLGNAYGDIEEEAGKKLEELCNRFRGLKVIGARMWWAIMQDQNKESFDAEYGSYIKTVVEDIK